MRRLLEENPQIEAIFEASSGEEALEMIEDSGDVKGNTGFGFHHKPERGL